MKKQKGFTLIELLVVIAIIGLLSTLAVVALNNARQKSRDARRISDVKQIQTALELYYNDQNAYPPIAGYAAGVCLSSSGGFAATCSGTTYMNQIPANPTPVDATASGCGGTVYTYAIQLSGASYTLKYCLGGTTGGIAGNTLKTATPAGLDD